MIINENFLRKRILDETIEMNLFVDRNYFPCNLRNVLLHARNPVKDKQFKFTKFNLR